MIAFAIVLVIIGAVLLAISSPRKGGNLEIGTSDIRTNLPEITGLAKVPAFILGLVLIGVGLWMGVLLFTKSLEEDDKKIAKNPQATSTSTAEVKPSPEIPIANVPTSTDTPKPLPTWTLTFTPMSPSPTQLPTATNIPSLNPVQATQVAMCQWLKEIFPQSLEEVKAKFNLPNSTTNGFSLVTEICPGVVNGFILHAECVKYVETTLIEKLV